FFHSSGALFVAVVVLIFDTYWVLRAVGVVTGVYGTMLRMRRDMKKDWLAMCRQQPPAGDVDPLQYFHLSVVPTYTEPYHVLERTVQAIVDANYPDELKLVGIITRENRCAITSSGSRCRSFTTTSGRSRWRSGSCQPAHRSGRCSFTHARIGSSHSRATRAASTSCTRSATGTRT